MYVLSKGTLPMDVGFMYSDTLEQLRPKLVLFKTFPEAAVAVEEMLAVGQKEGAPVDEEIEEQEGQEAEGGARPGADEEGEDSSSEDESEDGTAEPDSAHPSSLDDLDNDEEDAGRGKDPNAMTEEEEDEFARELAKMMVASNANETPRKPVNALDMGIPLIKRSAAVARAVEEQEELVSGSGGSTPGEGGGAARKGMQFTLLTKKGNKQQALSMEIPYDSSIAMSTTLQREQNRAEQERMKRLVLAHDARQEEADKQAYKEALARRGITLNYGAENRKKGVKVQVVP
ncbi:hypothetical protein JCM8547_004811, partial [Rhodosporidiobolus lusitaniae]